MITLRSTARCLRTPDVLFALEELQLPYALECVDDGYFATHHRRMGPLLIDGDVSLFEPNAILRHLMRGHGHALSPGHDGELRAADEWLDFMLSQLRPSLARLLAHRAGMGVLDARQEAEEAQKLSRAASCLEAALGERAFLLGRFTLVDCAFSLLVAAGSMGQSFDQWPRLAAYREGLAARPAWLRVSERARLPPAA